MADWWRSWLNWLLSDGDGLGDSDDWAVWWERWRNDGGWLWWSWWALRPSLSACRDNGRWDIGVCQPGGVDCGARDSGHRRAAWDPLGDGRCDRGWVDSRDRFCGCGLGDFRRMRMH